MPILFVFLDGVGLAPSGPHNPLAAAPTPRLRALLGGPLTVEQVQRSPDLLLHPIDAALGVEGLPQSGTGHVALLAGVNAPALHGRHQPNFPPVALRPTLAERSLCRRAREAGHSVAFANVFTPGYWQALEARRLRRSASVIAAEGAGLKLRTLDDLRAGQALSWDITGQGLHARDEAADIAPITPEEAGARLAALAREHDLVFYECSLPDLAGHERLGPGGVAEVLARIDGLIDGILAAREPATTLLITSDHGNIEDSSTRVHTLAPVPLLVAGPATPGFAAVRRIDQVAEAVLEALQAPGRMESPG
jgi:2,3-bisphosphoglycerate-independent phosphoglycerate mutase